MLHGRCKGDHDSQREPAPRATVETLSPVGADEVGEIPRDRPCRIDRQRFQADRKESEREHPPPDLAAHAIPGAEPSFYDNVTRVVGIDQVPDGYRAMNDREAIKVMVNPS
jgi:hypothetical protein